jgi:methyltransferase (TIGR00027 family)
MQKGELRACQLLQKGIRAVQGLSSYSQPDSLQVKSDDPLSSVLAGENARREGANLHREERLPYLAIRTRFFDDWLQRIVGPPLRQIVFLGAGMDTRAFRLPWPDSVQLWEIDCAELG